MMTAGIYHEIAYSFDNASKRAKAPKKQSMANFLYFINTYFYRLAPAISGLKERKDLLRHSTFCCTGGPVTQCTEIERRLHDLSRMPVLRYNKYQPQRGETIC
jgi:hypothetical protein